LVTKVVATPDQLTIMGTLQAITGYEPRDIHSTDYIFCNLQTTAEWISVKKVEFILKSAFLLTLLFN